MSYEIFFTTKAEKQLTRLAHTDVKKVIQKVGTLTVPLPQNLDIRKMVNTPNFYRLRIGKVRVLFEVDDKTQEIWIRKIKYRGAVYK
ncbi:MAG: hypothetical protein A3D39_00500 [Candidatus Buchananbacteria bacterium RIFCSPHIGHO2_02_FULL_39_17]|uniref:Plasmid stabilization protein n=1 Tax=Candidatus Buchananbacteria bacterium RIFCSPLOWO2_01_FULL_40_23b TaxID=1797544 RepID=A0A1G1YTB3_9BACT|nr:MAG: hypothetical protein A3D39_00500 [Candidatus Buchananbacteria bacterium RIFCSPHIGHO2_02_FULL_39_17]OGY55593.1 MAG: hypothetical protein A2912_01610 [Candidatus Buchananbacteria bacterium RIFCSPLOWO2_01_FULL_40_23b]